MIKITNDIYTKELNHDDLEKIKRNKGYMVLKDYLSDSGFNSIAGGYKHRFLKNPGLYINKVTIMTTDLNPEEALEKGVISSQFLNLFYYLELKDAKDRFIRNNYSLDGLSFDSRLDKYNLNWINNKYISDFNSIKALFKKNFLEELTFYADILVNRDRDFIFKYNMANPDAPMFIRMQDTIKLTVIKCWSLLDIKEFDKSLVDKLDFTDVEFLKDFRYLDSRIENFKMFGEPKRILENIDTSIEIITDWNRVYRSPSTGSKLIASDVFLDMDDVEKIINTKLHLAEMIIKNYGVKGFVLLFIGKTDSILFNAFFGAIAEYCIGKRDTHYSCKKRCDYIDNMLKALDEDKDILDLENYYIHRKRLRSGIAEKSMKALMYAFLNILNDESVVWAYIYGDKV